MGAKKRDTETHRTRDQATLAGPPEVAKAITFSLRLSIEY